MKEQIVISNRPKLPTLQRRTQNIRRREINIIICKHIKTYHREYRSTNQGERLFFLQTNRFSAVSKKKKEDKENKIGLSRFNNTMDTHHQSRFYPKADFVKASFLVAPHTLTKTPTRQKDNKSSIFPHPYPEIAVIFGIQIYNKQKTTSGRIK